jgi:Na+/H+ antiporter NhaD/arsenite permease-like protein
MMVVVAYLLFKPLMEVMPQKELAWLALSMSSTLAGNLTSSARLPTSSWSKTPAARAPS